jgi:hypothetical protein
MRWDALFDDLAAQAETLEHAERAAEVEDRARAEVGAVRFLDRLRAAVDLPLRVRTAAGLVAGTLSRLGRDWLLLEEDGGREVLVPLHAVLTVGGLPPLAAAPGTMDAVTRRLGLWFVLRRLARDRAPVRVLLADGTALGATVDRVGADFLEVAVVPTGEARRPAAVRDVLVVPMRGLVAVRREAEG